MQFFYGRGGAEDTSYFVSTTNISRLGGAGETSYFAGTKDISRLGGWRYKARFVFALLLCDFLHSDKIFVVFCSHKSYLDLFSSVGCASPLCSASPV